MIHNSQDNTIILSTVQTERLWYVIVAIRGVPYSQPHVYELYVLFDDMLLS